ncbi:MAG: hypothetical protein ACXW30_02425 [Micavibrio sp.]
MMPDQGLSVFKEMYVYNIKLYEHTVSTLIIIQEKYLMADDLSRDVEGTPIAFFKGKLTECDVSDSQPDLTAEDEGLARAQMLHELKAYVEWREYVTGIEATVFNRLREDPHSGISYSLCEGDQHWSDWSEGQKINFLSDFLKFMALSFDVEAPRLYLKKEWIALCEKLFPAESNIVYPDSAYAVYKSEHRSIVILNQAVLDAPFWWVLYSLTHEFGHHFISVQAEKLYNDLGECVDRRKFEPVYYDEVDIILKSPLCSVISCCDQNRFNKMKREEYWDYYYEGAAGKNYSDFLEERLVEYLAEAMTSLMKESVKLILSGCVEPSALIYANILLEEIRNSASRVEALSSNLGMEFDGASILNSIELSRFKFFEDYVVHQDEIERSVDLIGDQIELMREKMGGSFGFHIVAAYHQELFMYFIQGRLSVYERSLTEQQEG